MSLFFENSYKVIFFFFSKIYNMQKEEKEEE